MSTLTQPSFIGGEIAPGARGRSDLQRYGASLELAENFVIEPQGGASNRPGTEYAGKTLRQDGIFVRAIEFKPTEDEQYILEVGHHYIRVHDEDGVVITPDHPTLVGNGVQESIAATFGASPDFWTPVGKRANSGDTTEIPMISQSFTVPAGFDGFAIGTIEMLIAKHTPAGSPSAIPTPTTMSVWTDNNGVPGQMITGLKETNFTTFTPAGEGSANAVTGKWNRIGESVFLTPGQRYHCVARSPFAIVDLYTIIGTHSGDLYAGEQMCEYKLGVWTPKAGYDVFFTVLDTANVHNPNAATAEMLTSSDSKIKSQGFTIPAGTPAANVGWIEFKLGVVPFSGDADFMVAVYNDFDGIPNVPVAGFDFTDFTTRNMTALLPVITPKDAFVRFDHLNSVEKLQPGVPYHVIIKSVYSGSITSIPYVAATKGDYFTGGVAHKFNGSTWVALTVADHDLCFKIVGDAASEMILDTPYDSVLDDDIGTESVVHRLQYAQSVDVLTITDPSHTTGPRQLRRLSPSSWSFTPVPHVTNIGQPAAITAPATGTTLPGGTPARSYVYAAAGVSATGRESLPTLSAPISVGADISPTEPLTLEITVGTQPTDRYAIYKGQNGTFGFIGHTLSVTGQESQWDIVYRREYDMLFNHYTQISGMDPITAAIYANAGAIFQANAITGISGFLPSTTKYRFVDDNIGPDYADNPRADVNRFTLEGDVRPACVSYFAQRRVYANVIGQFSTLFFSELGDFDNHQRSFPAVASDAFEFTPSSGVLDEIRALLPLRSLFVFTAGVEYVISGNSLEDMEAPAVSHRGSSWLQPLVVGRAILFKDRGGIVRELVYAQDSNDWPTPDLGILASHLFTGHKVTAWAYTSSPRSVVWAVRSDGTMLPFTYVKEQDIAAWARITTKGKVKSICTTRQGGSEGESLYLIVDRVIKGATVKMLERIRPRNVLTSPFLDSSITKTLSNPSTPNGTVVVKKSPVNEGTIVDGILFGRPGFDKTNWVVVGTDGATLLEEIVTLGAGIVLFPGTRNLRGRIVALDTPIGGQSTSFFVELDQDIPDDLLTTTGTIEPDLVEGGDHGDALTPPHGALPLEVDAARPTFTATWALEAAIFGGFDHLIGETVGVVADGNVHPDVVVSDLGTITLQYYANSVVVGLRYVATLKTLPLSSEQSDIRSRQKSISDVAIEVAETRGVWIGEDENDLTEIKPVYRETKKLRTARLTTRCSNTWETSGAIFIKQIDPLPCSILSVSPEVTVGG